MGFALTRCSPVEATSHQPAPSSVRVTQTPRVSQSPSTPHAGGGDQRQVDNPAALPHLLDRRSSQRSGGAAVKRPSGTHTTWSSAVALSDTCNPEMRPILWFATSSTTSSTTGVDTPSGPSGTRPAPRPARAAFGARGASPGSTTQARSCLGPASGWPARSSRPGYRTGRLGHARGVSYAPRWARSFWQDGCCRRCTSPRPRPTGALRRVIISANRSLPPSPSSSVPRRPGRPSLRRHHLLSVRLFRTSVGVDATVGQRECLASGPSAHARPPGRWRVEADVSSSRVTHTTGHSRQGR